MGKNFEIEREGQINFFKNYGIPYEEDNSILVDNTDGVYNGNILEFKLNINNLNKVLFQAIKYLSRMRIKGESIPATILLIDLNNEKAYQYNTKDYLNSIQKVYIGAASKENNGFKGNDPIYTYEYSSMVESNKLKKVLKDKKTLEEMYIPIDIDEDCIVGWAERYYKELPTASKGDFLGDETGTNIKLKGEIREPKHFKGLINPYKGQTNEKFKYLMDCLNDSLSKKDLGAFYTHPLYAKKSIELVQLAIEKVPEGNDYIILDRCAGTGNLESALIGLYDKNGDEIISHCVVSTYEYYEYKVLNERIGDKVRDIIPPTEADVVYKNGKVSNADALSKDFIDNPIIKEYIDNPNCTIILFENPPFSEVAGNSETKSKSNSWKNSYVTKEMKKIFKGVTTNDSASVFIWSGFKYYLRQPTDSYIVFSPIKYWKSSHVCNKELVKSYTFNREHFHAGKCAITCNLWINKESLKTSFKSEVFDIKNEKLEKIKDIEIKQVFTCLSKANDKRTFDDDTKVSWALGKDGYIANGKKVQIKPIINDNIIGYMMHCGYAFGNEALQTQLTRLGYYGGHGYFLRKDNYLEKLPLFVAGWFNSVSEWYYRDIVYRCLDNPNKYKKDKDFIKGCLLWTCLSFKNRCISFKDLDNNTYLNELCFDANTLASSELKKYTLDDKEKELINLWNKILKEAKKTKNYNKSFTYGIYQIEKELNTYTEKGKGKKKEKVYDYPVLNGDLITLKSLLKEYYISHIKNKLFEYELIK